MTATNPDEMTEQTLQEHAGLLQEVADCKTEHREALQILQMNRTDEELLDDLKWARVSLGCAERNLKFFLESNGATN